MLQLILLNCESSQTLKYYVPKRAVMLKNAYGLTESPNDES